MKIKAQGLLNAAEYIERKFSRDNLASVLRECSDAVGNSYTSVTAIDGRAWR